jgi:hypothetical protein
VKAAAAAETLRQQWPEQLVFSVGTELTLFMQGIIEGNTLFERLNHPSFWETVKAGTHNEALNAFLARANEAVRQVYHGKIVYMSAPLEAVDWSHFDFVGVDLYRDSRIKPMFNNMIKRYAVHNKPIIIGEFGCCTYRGAEDAGGMGWAIIDTNGYENLIKAPVQLQLKGDYVRDESVQAREVTEMLEIFDTMGVEGAFVFQFASPTFPYNDNPKYDLDMASYSLVKSYADRCGATYPELTWEPKESFYSIADYYANHTIDSIGNGQK